MATELSDYLRSLEPGRELTVHAYEGAREVLRGLLYRELCRRGLWERPPRYLGIPRGRWPGEAINELVSDCYAAIFVERLKRLKARELVGNDVGGLIVLCVRNFVQDRQKGADPLGYKLYQFVSASLQRLAKGGELRLEPDGKILNDTVCAFGTTIPDKIPKVDLDVQVRALNDDLWLELIMAQGRARSGLGERLDSHLAGLSAVAEAFFFRDLIEPLKRDTRARWGQGIATEMAGWGNPATDQDLSDLRECVQRRIEQEDPKDRNGLQRLWAFLCDYVAGTNLSPVAEKAEKSGRPPTELGLEKALGDSRYRIAGFKATLGKMIEQCRSAVSGKGSVKSRGEVGLARMERHEQLRAATRRAAAAWSAELAEIDAAPRTPRHGDTFVFPGSGDLLVEWLVVEEGADGRLVVAVDDRPSAGSQDVALHPSVSGLASVRCAVAAYLHTAAFESAQRTGTFADDVLGRVLEKRASLADGSVVVSLAEQEVDDDPDYCSRMAELGKLRDALAGTGAPANTVAFVKKSLRRSAWWQEAPWGRVFALAAMLVLALGSTVAWQQLRITVLRDHLLDAPYANLPFVWLTASESSRGPEDPLGVPANARRLAFVLEVSATDSYPEYRVEMENKKLRQEVWSRDGFIETGSEVSFDLPASLLSDGEHEIRIYGLPEDGEPALLESYSLWIRLE